MDTRGYEGIDTMQLCCSIFSVVSFHHKMDSTVTSDSETHTYKHCNAGYECELNIYSKI